MTDNYKDTIEFAINCAIASIASGKLLCLTVSILRIFCVLEKENFLSELLLAS